jgi:hypothetical protein
VCDEQRAGGTGERGAEEHPVVDPGVDGLVDRLAAEAGDGVGHVHGDREGEQAGEHPHAEAYGNGDSIELWRAQAHLNYIGSGAPSLHPARERPTEIG